MAQVAKDFGISQWCLSGVGDPREELEPIVWVARPGSESHALREANKRIKLRVGDRGAASRGRVSLAGASADKMMYPVVRELAEDGIPVTVTCRVLKIARQPHYLS